MLQPFSRVCENESGLELAGLPELEIVGPGAVITFIFWSCLIWRHEASDMFEAGQFHQPLMKLVNSAFMTSTNYEASHDSTTWSMKVVMTSMNLSENTSYVSNIRFKRFTRFTSLIALTNIWYYVDKICEDQTDWQLFEKEPLKKACNWTSLKDQSKQLDRSLFNFRRRRASFETLQITGLPSRSPTVPAYLMIQLPCQLLWLCCQFVSFLLHLLQLAEVR